MGSSLCVLTFSHSSYAHSDSDRHHETIIILNTKATDKSTDFIQGLQKSCIDKSDVIVRDMDGNSKKAFSHLADIKEQISATPDKPPLLITLGGPATLLAQSQKLNIPIFYGLVGPTAQQKIASDGLTEIDMTVPYRIQLSQFKSILNNPKKIAILHDDTLRASDKEAFNKAGQSLSLDLLLIEVSSAREIPQAMRIITNRKLPVMFLPSHDIINRDSYRYIVRTLTENNTPSLVYSAALTKAGFLYAVEAQYFDIGLEYGALLCRDNVSRNRAMLNNYHPVKVTTTLNQKANSLINSRENDRNFK